MNFDLEIKDKESMNIDSFQSVEVGKEGCMVSPLCYTDC